jgi:xanthine dehydrogenase molybdenum-binding subunit
LWSTEASQVKYVDGACVGPNGQRLTFKELAEKLHATGGSITGNGSSSEATQGGAFGTHCVDVEVDHDTGKVQILRYTIAQDAGTAIHPSYVEGQMQGGVVQGIGWALNEEYWYDDQGMMRNATYLDYRIPTCYDVPMIDTIIVEVPDPQHPYGVRGVGAWSRRSADLSASGRHRQCDLSGCWCTNAAVAHVPATRHGRVAE